LESQLSELNNKLDVTQRELNDVTAAKNHAQSDVTDLSRQLEEAENEVSQLSRAKQALTKKFDEAKSTADNEAQAKSKLSAELRNAQVLSCLVLSLAIFDLLLFDNLFYSRLRTFLFHKSFHFYRAMVCIRGTSHGSVSVRLSVCPSQVGVLLKRLNVGSHKIRPHDSPGTLVF